MKRLLFTILFILFFAGTGTAQQYWLRQYTPTHFPLRVCSFIDSLRGWAAGDSGVIISTTNGGVNWSLQESRITESIHCLFFVNRKFGWGMGWMISKAGQTFGTRMIRTTNGGVNWMNYIYQEENIFMSTLYFFDSLNGFAGGYPNTIMKTSDGGFNWIPATIDTGGAGGFPVKHITFYNKKFGFAAGGFMDLAGVIWTSTNYGNFWKAVGIAPEPMVKIHPFDSVNVFSIGGDYEFGPGMAITTNGGIYWDYRTLNNWGVPSSLAFRTRDEGWAPLGWVPKFIRTTDGTKTWEDVVCPDSTPIFDIVFTDTRNGFCFGDSGKAYKFNYASVYINEPGNNTIPANFKLEQNYPNPFNPATTIKYDIPVNTFVNITIYDILGREIEALVNKKQTAGSYDIKWNAGKYPSGVYFYKLTTEYFATSKSMVLIK